VKYTNRKIQRNSFFHKFLGKKSIFRRPTTPTARIPLKMGSATVRLPPAAFRWLIPGPPSNAPEDPDRPVQAFFAGGQK